MAVRQSIDARWRQRPSLPCLRAVFLFGLWVVVAHQGWARLPEEGLRRAQEAERALAAKEPARAINILVELDALYPGEPAINLRLAEIYDQQGQLGAALFYYRRYVELAGPKARQTAKERVQTLEMTAGAREAAEAIAARLGQKPRAVATPKTQLQRAVEKMLPDGTRVRVDSAEELMSEKVDPGKRRPLEPTPSDHPLAKAEVIIRDGESESSEAATARRNPRLAFTPPPIVHPLTNESTPVAAPEVQPREPSPLAVDSHRRELGLPAPTPSLAEPTHSPQAPQRVAARGTNGIHVEFAPAQKAASSQRAAKTSPRPSALVAATPTPTLPPSLAGLTAEEAQKFFIVHPVGGEQASLSLANETDECVVVVSAIPSVPGGRPVNAIVGPHEARIYDVIPGHYTVHVLINDNAYPPVTLLDRRFEYTFEPGMSYARRFASRRTR